MQPSAQLVNRWIQLALGVVCLLAIANVQYGWTLFIKPIEQKHGWADYSLQWAFTIVITTETWLAMPIAGRLVDRFGPKLVCCAGPLLAIAWLINSIADALLLFYLAAVISGLATGLVFATVYGNALRWFPDRRGFAAGVTAAGFAGGGFFTVIPLAFAIKLSGYQAAYLWFGLAQGAILLVSGLFLQFPRQALPSVSARPQLPRTLRDFSPREVLSSAPFWLMYISFVLVGAGGLMLPAQLGPIARDFGLYDVPLTILGITLPTAVFALSFSQAMNGVSRFAFGSLSDWIGRERTMFIAFVLEACAFLALIFLPATPLSFVLMAGLVLFAWGEIFSLFPALCTDTFGSRFASVNYGMLSTAKGVAALLVPLASILKIATGSWTAVFAVAAIFNVIAALIALSLKPIRKRLMDRAAAYRDEALA